MLFRSRKEAIKTLETAREARNKEIIAAFKEARETLAKESKGEKEKVTAKIKNKEQLTLALNEVDLESRKKTVILTDEEEKTRVKTDQLFDNLISLVKGVKPLTILSEDEYEELAQHQVADFLTARMGADAVLNAIEKVNLEETAARLKKDRKSVV